MSRIARAPLRPVESLEPRTLLSAQLVADVNTAPGSSNPANVLTANGLTFFAANDNVHGIELWRTDGTADGTFLIKDISPGPASSSPRPLAAVGQWVYFVTSDNRFWRTDGTAANTAVAASLPGATTFFNAQAQTAVTLGDSLVFGAGNNLYHADPRNTLVFSIETFPASSTVVQAAVAGSKAYFLTSDDHVWVSDGTSAGTKILVDLGTTANLATFRMFAVGDTLYYTPGNDLWKTQGTAASTTLVKDLPAGFVISDFAAVGGTLYFAFNTSLSVPASGSLWKTDGTDAGTVKIKSSAGSLTFTPTSLTTAGSRLVFVDRMTPDGKVYTSDGTDAGTVVLSGSIRTYNPTLSTRLLRAVGDTVYFVGTDATNGGELWKIDGAATTPALVADLTPGAANSDLALLDTLGDRLLFTRNSPDTGREIWTSQGSAADTAILKDINTGTDDSRPSQVVSANGGVLFTAIANDRNTRVFVAPTASGGAAQMLRIGDGGPLPGSPDDLTRVGDLVYFSAHSGSNVQIIASDGTSAGTRIVKELPSAVVDHVVAAGSRLFFTYGNFGSSTLYTTDGTDAGTIPLAGDGKFTYSNSAALGDGLFFTAALTGGTVQLWHSDGTPAGTAPITPTVVDPSPSMTPFGDRLYYRVGGRLYATDGTPGGTTEVAVPGLSGSIRNVLPLADRLVLTISGAIYSFKPGDPAPTLLPTSAGYDINTAAVPVGKLLYFAVSASSGNVLYRTDGTARGTLRLTGNGIFPSTVTNLTAVGDRLYFTNDTRETGREVWTSDGTPGGTYVAADIIPGVGSSIPANLADVGGTLYFSASDGVHGQELFRVVDDIAPTAVATAFVPAARSARITVTFSENVAPSLTLDDWQLTDRATGQDVSDLLTSLAFDPDADTATLTFAPTLPDGDYRLTLPSGAVADPVGNPSAAAITLDFFQLPGDVNRDRAVDFNDLVVLAQNYNATGKTSASGDLTGDGKVDFEDLVVLAQRYNTSLPPPPAPAAAAPPQTRAAATTLFRLKPAPKGVAPRPKPVTAVARRGGH